jgi:Uma2 family endonuclease
MVSIEGMRAPPQRIPPLEPGDRLTRKEFERRFDATPGLTRAELIEGIVYMPPPASFREHSQPNAHLVGLLIAYAAATPHVLTGTAGSLRLGPRNMPQPDAHLMIAAEAGGQARIDKDDYVAGAPELVAEVAASSASYDLHVKKDVYRRSGVREYVVWRTYDAAIDYFILRGERYVRLAADADGLYRSRVFPGLWLAVRPLLAGDLAAALAGVQAGIASSAHAAFVERLRRRAAARR